jgi:hypothetical protein
MVNQTVKKILTGVFKTCQDILAVVIIFKTSTAISVSFQTQVSDLSFRLSKQSTIYWLQQAF